MAEEGFAIICPYCGHWNVWPNAHPKSISIRSIREFKQVRQISFGGFSHPKLLRCNSPRWLCPSSFEVFVFENEALATKCLGTVKETRSVTRDFRLYKTDCKSRWDRPAQKYIGIMICTEPVPRLTGIELETLMDQEIFRRLLIGMSVEIDTPMTIYAARTFEHKKLRPSILWIPTEPYFERGVSVPHGYNKFCECCRNIVIGKLDTEFSDAKYGVDNCPIGFGVDGTCAGKKPACLDRDWNCCPAFLEKRGKRCPFYNSDLHLIQKIEHMWHSGQEINEGVRHKTHAGFIEVAFPILVDSHLVGVAITGQMFLNKAEVASTAELVSDWNILEGFEDKIESAKKELFREEEERAKTGRHRFLITGNELDRRIKLLRLNVQRLTGMLNSKYFEIYTKNQLTFRQEVLNLIRDSKTWEPSIRSQIIHILKRMQEFWGVGTIYLARHSFATAEVSIISVVGANKDLSFRFPGVKDRICGKQVYTSQSLVLFAR